MIGIGLGEEEELEVEEEEEQKGPDLKLASRRDMYSICQSVGLGESHVLFYFFDGSMMDLSVLLLTVYIFPAVFTFFAQCLYFTCSLHCFPFWSYLIKK